MIGLRISRNQHAQSNGNVLVSLWAQSCIKAVCNIERELYSVGSADVEGEVGYFYNESGLINGPGQSGERKTQLALALALRALAIVSETGQPRSKDVHMAKQSLNTWAEDAFAIHKKGGPKPSPYYMPLLQARARMVSPWWRVALCPHSRFLGVALVARKERNGSCACARQPCLLAASGPMFLSRAPPSFPHNFVFAVSAPRRAAQLGVARAAPGRC